MSWRIAGDVRAGARSYRRGQRLPFSARLCGDYGDTVDLNALTANDISAILHTYGVEAARATIIQEVTGVFGVYGIDIEPHHLSLIADFMTAGGGYRAMNRGAMMDHSSPVPANVLRDDGVVPLQHASSAVPHAP